MKIDTDSKKIDELLSRGVVEVIHKESLQKKLKSGEKLRIKLGIDPTSPSIHLGRAIPLLKLKDFQDLGHQIVFIVGDFTGVIGDTSDKDSERPMLGKEEIEENKKTYKEQIAKILDIDKVEFKHNSEWLEKLSYREVCEQADQFSVADFIARENIKKRIDTGKRVSLRETLYPLLQGYDSVAVEADVEVGGTDQRFNLLAGRTLQGWAGQEPQDIIMGTLINGLDGRKMSSSWGNTIPLNSDPADMFGKVMSLADGEIVTYFTVCTRTPMEEVLKMEAELKGESNPRDIKILLARAVVSLYHSETDAKKAEEAFVETFQKGNIPDDIPEIKAPFVENLIASGIVDSKSELRRLLDAGGVRDAKSGEKLDEMPESFSDTTVLKIGKRRFVKLLQ